MLNSIGIGFGALLFSFLFALLAAQVVKAQETVGIKFSFDAPTKDTAGNDIVPKYYNLYYVRDDGELVQRRLNGSGTILRMMDFGQYGFRLSTIAELDINGEKVTKEGPLSDEFFLDLVPDFDAITPLAPTNINVEVLCDGPLCETIEVKVIRIGG